MAVTRPQLLVWVERLAAIAQSGLAFEPHVYDRQRYEELRSLAAEMAAYPGDGIEEINEVFSDARGYATPKVICRAATFDPSGKVLMVREVADGRWTLPGGWIDIGESPAAAVEREVLEETGYRVRALKLAAVYDKLRHPHPPAPFHAYLLFFVCDLLGGEATPSVETSEVGWFDEEALPELSVGRATAAQIRRMFVHARTPDLATDFDR